MDKAAMQQRTKKFHIEVIRTCSKLPKTAAGFETAKQLIRSGGSVGANYRAACRAKSTADFIYKLEVVIEEADESKYWLEVATEADLINQESVLPLINEANELISMLVASVKTIKKNREISG